MNDNVKVKLTMLALFAALIANTASAQYNSRTNTNGTYSSRNNTREEVISRTDDPNVYTDQGGEYHWQTVEKRVWIPEYEKSGIFGRKTVPGHYEIRTDRVKIYHNQSGRNGQYNQNGQNGQYGRPGEQGWGQHNPHGMPPGQRKKLEKNGSYDYDGRYSKGSKDKHSKNDRDDDDRDHDWNRRDNRNENRQ